MKVFLILRSFAWRATFAVVAIAVSVLAAKAYFQEPARRILIAPMMGLDTCLTPTGKPVADAHTEKELAAACSGPQGSAAALVESTLSGLQLPGAGKSRYELGYTLNVPLLKLFKEYRGDWVIDKELLGRLVRTVRDTERPVIVYLFSTHFGEKAPIEAALAADPANLSWTAQGPLPKDVYYETDIYNWSFASTRTAITARRVQAAQAVLREICKLEPQHVKRIRGITLLGETHHLFPNFAAGMGFAPPYLVSDYSDVSKAGFREFVERYFGNIENLNRNAGTNWTSFAQVQPPWRDVRTARDADFSEHIDSFAHGTLPITGWAYVKGASEASPPLVRIYRNGDLIARVPVNMGRQDVLATLPEFGTANTGWRFDMDFKKLPAGLYRIDAVLEKGPEDLVQLGTRNISILDRNQPTKNQLPQKKLPSSRVSDPAVRGYVDVPVDRSSYMYNPLVTYWHAFRALQVVGYIQKFNQAATAPCLSATARYTHQIIPFTNPGWDETKFAIDASLQKLDGINLGVSLYGEPTYGTSFSNWLSGTRHKHYGVTEFHPLKALDPAEFQRVLDLHSRQGVDFISFFMEPRWKRVPVSHGKNLFSFDPDNDEFGSRQLYQSVQKVLSAPRPPQ